MTRSVPKPVECYEKDPGASVVYGMDWTPYLDGATITDRTVTAHTYQDGVTPMTVTGVGNVGRIVSARATGGSHGVHYLVFTITDSNGNTDVRSHQITVVDR